MPRIYTHTNDMREGVFRFGQAFTYNNAKFFLRRHPFARFIAGGLPYEALSSFNLVKPDSARVKVANNNQLIKQAKLYYTELKRGVKLSRTYGKAYFQFYKHKGVLIFRAFEPANYDADYDEVGNIIEVNALALVRGVGSSGRQTWKGAALDVGFELINEQTDIKGEGLSELEVIWDVLYAVYMLVSHSAYFVARAGAGLKKLIVPETALDQDSDLASELAASMADFGSAHDVIVQPKTINGVDVEFELVTVENKAQFLDLLDIYIIQLAAVTGVPQSVWKGIAKGTLDSGKINEESYFDVLRDIRSKYETLMTWFMDAISSFSNITLEEDYIFDFSKRDEMSEDDQIIFTQKQLTVVSQYIKLGIKKEKAFELAGLEMDAADFAPEPEPVDENMGFSGQNTPSGGDSDLRKDAIVKPNDKK